MKFKPTLASSVENESQIKFPVLVSHKLDGIRAMVQGGKLVSRTLTDIPNINVQARFKGLEEGLDGELISGDPCLQGCMQRTNSIVMSDDKPAGDLRYHVFDKFSELPFIERLREAAIATIEHDYCVFVQHQAIDNIDDLNELTAAWLKEGHEGVMLRAPYGRYKQGRSSVNEGLLLRIKPMIDAEAVVVGTYELEHNANPATQDNLGHTKRSTCQANFVGLDSLGGFFVKGINGEWKDVEFKCGTGVGLTQDLRKSLWKEKEKLVGRIIKYKYQKVGSKDKPRLPIWMGWRDVRDM
jgi:DNA ligase 1